MAGSARSGRPDKIELLTECIIDDYPSLALEILGCSSRLSLPLGWHYVLDIVWILKELEVRPGSVILDAGAGNGLLQYVLAGRGYTVISADMMDRRIPEFAPWLYHVAEINDGKAIEHSYKSHVSRDRQRNDIGSIRPRVSLLTKVLDTPLRDIPRKSVDYLLRRHPQQKGSKGDCSDDFLSQPYEHESQSILQGPGNKPQIVYYYTTLNSMDRIPDESVDAVVSVSALEHNLPREVAGCLDEFRRVLKPGAWTHITVSATYPHSAFHEPSHSWLLNEEDAQRTYLLRPGYHTNFSEFPAILAALKKPKYLEKWLSLQYFRSGTNGMPWGRWDPQYVPMGISLRASSLDNHKG